MKEEVFRVLVNEGIDGIRLNLSHGSYEEHEIKVKLARKYSRFLPVMADLTGPSLRVSLERPLKIRPGTILTLGKDLKFNFPVEKGLKPGMRVLIADGSVVLEVIEENPPVLRVLYGDLIEPNKNVNIPGLKLDLQLPTEKDSKDILWAKNAEVDILAPSFISSAKDIKKYREFMEEIGYDAWIFAKIETAAAVEEAEKILGEADGIIIARGDLALEIPFEKLPAVQKKLINLANRKGKPAVVATQLLSSMVSQPFPTRAEISDVANAVFDGASALMLTNETAMGSYPVESVKVLRRIISEAEKAVRPLKEIISAGPGDAIALAAVKVAEELKTSVILAPTRTGVTPRRLARFLGRFRIFAITASEAVARRCNLLRGVSPIVVQKPFSEATLKPLALKLARELHTNFAICTNVNPKGGEYLLKVYRR